MIETLYENNDLVVVIKPINMPVQKDFSRSPDLVSELKGQFGIHAHLIHRLDRHVSGPLVLAKNKRAAADLNKQMTTRGFRKIYRAVTVSSDLDSVAKTYPEHEIVPIRLYYMKNKGVAKVVDDDAYEQLKQHESKQFKLGTMKATRLQTAEFEGEWLHLMEIELETGRFHQIRAGLGFLGLPILGDSKYGIRQLGDRIIPAIGLACTELGFYLGSSGTQSVYKYQPLHAPFDIWEHDVLPKRSES